MDDKSPWWSPFQAKVSANILAKLGGDDPGLLVLGIIFLLLTIFSLGFETYSPSLLSRTAGVVGLVGLGTLLVRWCFKGSGQVQSEGERVTIAVAQDLVRVETTIRHPKEAARLLRAVIQGRGEFPAPHGEVKGDPSRAECLRAYAEDERQQVTASLRAEIGEHDKRVLGQLDAIEPALPEELPAPDTANAAGIEPGTAGP